jgi:hypothetical protein
MPGGIPIRRDGRPKSATLTNSSSQAQRKRAYGAWDAQIYAKCKYARCPINKEVSSSTAERGN